MDYNQIDVFGNVPGCGQIWQGGSVDGSIDQPPFTGPLLVVCMDRGESNEQFINHTNVEAVLAVWIDDAPTACLKDDVLQKLAKMIVTWITFGGSVYLHCAAGVSRASYIDIAVHCTAMGISAKDALALVKHDRPVANPNSGFMTQLNRLWPSS